MRRAGALLLLAGVACRAGLPRASAAEGPPPETIFMRAKDAWRARDEAPFVSFSLRERYMWRGRAHDNWWQAAYRNRDRDIAMHRLIVPADEAQRLKGSPIALNIRFHRGLTRADSLDTNSNADAFPMLDPLIEPNASFGLVRSERKAALVSSPVDLVRSSTEPAVAGSSATSPSTASPPSSGLSPLSSPSALSPPPASPSGLLPAPLSAPEPRTPANGIEAEKPLRELVRVEAVARDYTIAFAGTERVRDDDAYHLTLVPLRDPRLYRLRDLWVGTTTYATLQLGVQGLFEGKPYEDARWLVTYVRLNGRYYVQQIKTDEALRFGLDRIVTGLQYDFVAYDFPATIPDIAFQRLL